ncbi:GNAT family N-acetyltransferase [Bacillus niameyensis]|uniref:GNAT family N-acetyltransferase n=1 Tax=Bacillus niameyensis TaxID=1522308 RepID=UPI000780264F|nr:GNAT family protein [Bacillus niameyensis]
MKFSSGELWLSKVSLSDLDFICRIECDESLWSYEESIESDIDVVYKKYIERIDEDRKGQNYDFIVSLVDEIGRKPIGIAQIWSYVDFRKSWEIGYAILPEFSGQGYGSQAANLLLKFAFEKLSAHKVVGMCNSQNVRSAALMERLGMTREAILKEELYWQNQWTDQYYYSILEKEYFSKR